MHELKARIGARFDRLDPPSWPDPHPDRLDRPPGDDEYSRLTDPGRYVVVHARARAWAEELRDVLGARVDRLPPPPDDGAVGSRRAFDRGVRVTSPRPGTLPLLLLERDVREGPQAEPLSVLVLAVARPEVEVDTFPDCGCDACDDGSAPLLEALDESIGHVVGGPYVALHAATWGVRWHPDGLRAHSEGARSFDHARLARICRQLVAGEDVRPPAGTKAFVGRSWLD